MKRIGLLIGIAALVMARDSQAGVERAGTTAANFLSIGSGARVLGMGGASLGLANGLVSSWWNAGALGFMGEGEITLSHSGLADQSAQECAGAGGRLGWSDLRWSASGLFQGEGSFEGRDASNNTTESFNISNTAFGAVVARPLGSHAALGVGAKWVNESLGPGLRGSGVTFDAGMLVRMGVVGVGLAAQNVGGHMAFGSESYPFPTSYGAGIAVEHKSTGLSADLDFNAPSDYYANLRAGVEWSYRERLALRAGYRKELSAPSDDALNGPAFGLGAGARGLWLDYGYVVSSNGEGQHRMGISLRPGRMGLTSDPFGQKDMPRDFDTAKSKPAPPATPAKGAKKR